MNNELCSDDLAVAIEQQMVSVRVFGKLKNVVVQNEFCFFATGCNILIRGDLVRRTLLCTLDPNQETPEKRSFARNPYAEILTDRGKYIAAIMTIVRAYFAASKPDVECAKLASFDATFVQKPLVWLGVADPAASMATSAAYDPEASSITKTLAA